MDMRKYLELFISETREHLEEAAEAIPRLEESPKDEELLNLLFRHGHSIKGMAASMGYQQIADVSHALEDRFDDLRAGKGTVTASLVERAMQAIDAMSDAIDALEQGGKEPADALRAVAARLREPDEEPPASGGAAPPPVDGAPPPPAAGGTAAAAAAAGGQAPTSEGWIYNAEITIGSSAPMPAARALVLYKKLESLGKIRFAKPEKDQIASGRFDGKLLVQFHSGSTEERLRSELRGIPELESLVLTPFQAASEEKAAPPSRPAAPAAPAPATPVATVRIRTDTLDRFLDHLGELIIHGGRLQNSLWPGPEGKAADALGALRKTLDRLQGDLMSLRMVPFEHIASRFVRSVRNLGGNLGKRVTLSIHGREVRLDRSILEDLVDPINHILRNAVDHGIEPPDERSGCGKDPVGRITIRNTEESDSVTIEIEDDGRGMDPERIRRVAVERAFLSEEEARVLSDADALMMVTTPGFSTAERLTEVSGRGVGMDVVRTRIESLGGRLRIESKTGAGTRIRLSMPFTIAVIHAFLVRAGETVYAVPVTSVQRTFEAPDEEVRSLGGNPVMQLGEETVELLYLHQLMGDAGDNGNGSRPDADGAPPALLFYQDERPVGLVVDAVLAKRDVVVKPLRSPLENLREFSGATILEDGKIALILDVMNLSR